MTKEEWEENRCPYCTADYCTSKDCSASRISIPVNATNGDMIKALLKTTIRDVNCAFIWIDCGEGYCPAKFDIDWWNAPYKKEGDEE